MADGMVLRGEDPEVDRLLDAQHSARLEAETWASELRNRRTGWKYLKPVGHVDAEGRQVVEGYAFWDCVRDEHVMSYGRCVELIREDERHQNLLWERLRIAEARVHQAKQAYLFRQITEGQRARARWKGPAPRRRAKAKIGARLRFLVFRRDGFRCVYCGAEASQATLHADHVVPESQGGPTEFENLATACERCNLGKHTLRVGSGVGQVAEVSHG